MGDLFVILNEMKRNEESCVTTPSSLRDTPPIRGEILLPARGAAEG